MRTHLHTARIVVRITCPHRVEWNSLSGVDGHRGPINNYNKWAQTSTNWPESNQKREVGGI